MAAIYSMTFKDGDTVVGSTDLTWTTVYTFLQLKQNAWVQNFSKAWYKLLWRAEEGSSELIPDNRTYKASTMAGDAIIYAVLEPDIALRIHNTRIRR